MLFACRHAHVDEVAGLKVPVGRHVDDAVDIGRIGDRKSTTSELQSPMYLVCRLLLEKKKKNNTYNINRCILYTR